MLCDRSQLLEQDNYNQFLIKLNKHKSPKYFKIKINTVRLT